MREIHANRRWSLALWAGLAALSAGVASGHPGQGAYSDIVSIVTVQLTNQADLLKLKNEGYDIAGVDQKHHTADVITHNRQEGVALRFVGFNVKKSRTIDTRIAPDSGYKTADQITQILQQYVTDHPTLAHVESIGKSLEGRDIWALKVSTTPDSHDPKKPVILYNGMHHAREVMSPEVVLDTADYLLTKYGSDAQATKWVNENEIWLIPMLNPDGNNMVWTSDNMWRKNTRNGYGVDINRNYPYAWNSCNGSSADTGADDYHGPSAASEPETQAMVAFVTRIQPVFDISYHSYSELVIYPYGCQGVHSETADVVEPLGKQMAGLIPADSGSGNYTAGTAWETLYDVDGDDVDWMYHEQHVMAYVIEMNDSGGGFQPPYTLRDPTVQKLRPAWQLLLDRVDQSGVRGIVTATDGTSAPATVVTVAAAGQDASTNISWKIRDDGSYHLVLNPGMYTLTFALGAKTVTKQVTVGTDRVNLDVQMQ